MQNEYRRSIILWFHFSSVFQHNLNGNIYVGLVAVKKPDSQLRSYLNAGAEGENKHFCQLDIKN